MNAGDVRRPVSMRQEAIATIVLLALLGASAASADPAKPEPVEDWRFPTEADYARDWETFREQFPTPFHVKADFDGDGAPDDAWIMISSKGAGWALFVFLNRSSNGGRVIRLLSRTSGVPQNFGIAIVKPGIHRTACGKGFACGPGDAPEIMLDTPGFSFFKFESASSIFYWDHRQDAFRRVYTSD